MENEKRKERKFLIGQKLHLRQLELEDINGNYIHWFDDSEVCKWNSHHTFPKSHKELCDFISNQTKTSLNLAIILDTTNEHIGNISLHQIDYINRSAAYGIILGEKKYWGKNYAKEAVLLIIEHGFLELNLNRIWSSAYAENAASRAVMQSLGFIEEGRRRQAAYKHGKYLDIIEYGLLRSEFEASFEKI